VIGLKTSQSFLHMRRIFAVLSNNSEPMCSLTVSQNSFSWGVTVVLGANIKCLMSIFSGIGFGRIMTSYNHSVNPVVAMLLFEFFVSAEAVISFLLNIIRVVVRQRSI